MKPCNLGNALLNLTVQPSKCWNTVSRGFPSCLPQTLCSEGREANNSGRKEKKRKKTKTKEHEVGRNTLSTWTPFHPFIIEQATGLVGI